MKQKTIRKATLFILMALIFTNIFAFNAQSNLDSLITNNLNYLKTSAKNPTISSAGGDWTILAHARNITAKADNDYLNLYYDNAGKFIKDKKGVLNDIYYTEYARVILAMSSISKDSTNISGYNLVEYLYDYDKVTNQGINAVAYALLALDSKNYSAPEGLREKYIDFILKSELKDGGFAFFGDAFDPDITAMVLQCFAPYQKNEDVKAATDRAILACSKNQRADGGFSWEGNSNIFSTSQVVLALSQLGINTETDSRFIKDKSAFDNMISFAVESGGFSMSNPPSNTDINISATEQATLALIAHSRLEGGRNMIFSMSDSISIEKAPVVTPEKTSETPIIPDSTDETISEEINEENKTTPESSKEKTEETKESNNSNNKKPNTSDENINLYLTLFTLSIISLSSVVIFKRKRNEK